MNKKLLILLISINTLVCCMDTDRAQQPAAKSREGKQYKCSINFVDGITCDAVFESNKNLVNHQRMQHLVRGLVCPTFNCHLDFGRSMGKFYEHLTKCGPVAQALAISIKQSKDFEKYRCNKCNAVFYSTRKKRTHSCTPETKQITVQQEREVQRPIAAIAAAGMAIVNDDDLPPVPQLLSDEPEYTEEERPQTPDIVANGNMSIYDYIFNEWLNAPLRCQR